MYTRPDGKSTGWCFRCKFWASPKYCKQFLASHLSMPTRVHEAPTDTQALPNIMQVMSTLPKASTCDAAKEYLEARKVTEHCMDVWDIRYCGFGKYCTRVIIPTKHTGVWVDFTARTIVGEEPKYLSAHGRKIIWCWPVGSPWYIMVEGIFDAMRVAVAGFPALCIFGADISQDMRMQITQLRLIQLFTLPDPDGKLVHSVMRHAWPFPVQMVKPFIEDPGATAVEMLRMVLASECGRKPQELV